MEKLAKAVLSYSCLLANSNPTHSSRFLWLLYLCRQKGCVIGVCHYQAWGRTCRSHTLPARVRNIPLWLLSWRVWGMEVLLYPDVADLQGVPTSRKVMGGVIVMADMIHISPLRFLLCTYAHTGTWISHWIFMSKILLSDSQWSSLFHILHSCCRNSQCRIGGK